MFSDDRQKRELRQLKREIKRAGSQRRRRLLKRDLIENPEEAHHSEFNFGRCSSASMNGMDRKPVSSTDHRSPQTEASDGPFSETL